MIVLSRSKNAADPVTAARLRVPFQTLDTPTAPAVPSATFRSAPSLRALPRASRRVRDGRSEEGSASCSSRSGRRRAAPARRCSPPPARSCSRVTATARGWPTSRGTSPRSSASRPSPTPGLTDWLAAGPEAPADALERLAVIAAPGVALLPRGSVDRPLAPVPAAEAGAALAVALRDGPVPTIVDAGTATSAASPRAGRGRRRRASSCSAAATSRSGARSAHHCSSGSAVWCWSRSPAARSGAAEVARRARPAGARPRPGARVDRRAVDAGVLAGRLPEPLARPVMRMLTALGVVDGRTRRGRVTASTRWRASTSSSASTPVSFARPRSRISTGRPPGPRSEPGSPSCCATRSRCCRGRRFDVLLRELLDEVAGLGPARAAARRSRRSAR